MANLVRKGQRQQKIFLQIPGDELRNVIYNTFWHVLPEEVDETWRFTMRWLRQSRQWELEWYRPRSLDEQPRESIRCPECRTAGPVFIGIEEAAEADYALLRCGRCHHNWKMDLDEVVQKGEADAEVSG